MSAGSDALSWRRARPELRAAVCARWSWSLVRDAEAVLAVWSRVYSQPASALFAHELAAIVAALHELAAAAPSALEPSRARRWLAAEPVRSRFEPAPTRVVLVGEHASPSLALAWVATALAAGSEVLVRCAPSVAPALEAAIERLDRESEGAPVRVEPSLDELAAPEDSLVDSFSTPRPEGAVGRDFEALPALAWVDDDEAPAQRAPALLAAARYGGGRFRGSLRWVAARPSALDALWSALSRRPDAKQTDGALFVGETRCVRGRTEPDAVRDASALWFEAVDDEARFVERARELGPWAAACGFGRDVERARSLAARALAATIFVNSTPAAAVGGLLRAEFDARAWLRAVTREVPVVVGPPGSIARWDAESPARSRWLRSLVRAWLGRHGWGGRVEDLW